MGRIQRDFILFVFGRRWRRRYGSWRLMMDYLWWRRLMMLNMMLNRFLIELWQMSAKFARWQRIHDFNGI
jgi:hypothetical protein